MRKKYTKEFKEKAIKKVLNKGDKSFLSVAKGLGINEATLRNWMPARTENLEDKYPFSGVAKRYSEEIFKLKKENILLKKLVSSLLENDSEFPIDLKL